MELKRKSTKAQEEMIGFVLIVVLVIVVLVIFLGFSLRSPVKESVESYEVDNFMQVLLFYTTNCKDDTNNYIITRDLIRKCAQGKECVDGRDTCDVLNQTISETMNLIWDISEYSQYSGYEMNISLNNQEVIYLKKGNITNNYKGPKENIGANADIDLKIYY